MMTLDCQELEIFCDFIARAPSRDDLIPLVEEHVRGYHGFKELPVELKAKILDLAQPERGARKI